MEYTGLTTIQAEEALKKYGLNELPNKKSSSSLKLLFSQVKNLLSLLLVIAAIISFVVGDKVDSLLILLILVLNTFLGFWQEYKASRELEALRKLEVSKSRCIRDGQETEISSTELVPGDIIIIEQGDKIPSDALILESHDFSVNEASLTGESVPVVKSSAEDDNQIFFGTTAVTGRAKARIVKTGSETKFGKIALMLAEVEEEPTPLEVSIGTLAKRVGLVTIALAILVFSLRLYQGFEIFEVFFTSVALMVAAVPEGLPTAITVALAIGVHRMYKKKTLVRRMSAIESLGATTLICSDKTGTLTENKMTLRKALPYLNSSEDELMKASVICNSASLILKEDHGTFDVLGDSTEGALLLWAKEKGKNPEMIKKQGKIIEEEAFDVKRKMMSVLWQDQAGGTTVYSKGAPEVILAISKLSDEDKKKINQEYEEMAKTGLRVLALAKSLGVLNTNRIEEKNLQFLGLVGIADPPRMEAKETIQKAKNAGIKIVMVTGDHALTAKAIAEEIGLIEPGDEVLTGEQLNELSDETLKERIGKVRIFARVEPQHKLRIIKIYQRLGEVVSVTGDGVNDALALKQAHVGVAMGTTGTDVAKEASDLVILDDNLSTLVQAVEQGRLVYANILKTVKFLLSGNLSEILLIAVAVLAGLPTPLLPAQILWINFVTDGLPALALSMDSPSKHIMQSPPRRKNVGLLNSQSIHFILGYGGLIALICLLMFWGFLNMFNLEIARSYTFSLMVVLQMVLVFVMRRHHSVFSNKYLFWAAAFVLLSQALILYYPPFQSLFKVESGL